MLRSRGYERLTELTTSAALTVPEDATHCTLQAEGADVRYRDDGDAPTATVGGLVRAAAIEPLFYRGRPRDLQVIEADAGAILNVFYYSES